LKRRIKLKPWTPKSMDFKSLLLNIGLCKTSDVETENKKCGPFEVKS